MSDLAYVVCSIASVLESVLHMNFDMSSVRFRVDLRLVTVIWTTASGNQCGRLVLYTSLVPLRG